MTQRCTTSTQGPDARRCTCGAKHTSFPDCHHSWCDALVAKEFKKYLIEHSGVFYCCTRQIEVDILRFLYKAVCELTLQEMDERPLVGFEWRTYETIVSSINLNPFIVWPLELKTRTDEYLKEMENAKAVA